MTFMSQEYHSQEAVSVEAGRFFVFGGKSDTIAPRRKRPSAPDDFHLAAAIQHPEDIGRIDGAEADATHLV
jgi:hypothetical protein